MSLIMSILGMVVLLAIAVLLSENRKAINIRTVGGAFAIQFILGGFILFVPWGQALLNTVSKGVQNVINYGQDGIRFLFGSLVDFSVEGIGFIFAFQVLPTVVFFSSLISVLYYLGIMQFIIKVLGGGLRKLLGTSHAESMSATANIFVGQTEAPLVVRPFVPKMTQSELFAVMCGGMASVAGGVLAGYAAMGVPLPYLIAASFMAAPGGLLFAKIIKPETQVPIDQLSLDEDDDVEKPANIIDAAAGGAASGMQLALNIGAMLLAFIGLIALINGIVGWFGGIFGFGDEGIRIAFAQLQTVANEFGLIEIINQSVIAVAHAAQVDMTSFQVTTFDVSDVNRDILFAAVQGIEIPPQLMEAFDGLKQASQERLSLELVLGWIFAPLAFLIGVPWAEAQLAGSFIGQKLVVNEFVAYLNFAPMIPDLSAKTVAIISFALCGFANLSSVAILLGGLGSIAPTRRHDIARFGIKAVAAGTLSNLMSATIAGFFLSLATLM